MRKLLSVFAIFSIYAANSGTAFGNARLPIINLSAGSISAREAFGENPKPKAKNIDKNEKVISRADILSPQKPSSDLWARSGVGQVEKPLRLPESDEFVAIKNSFQLPEEDFDNIDSQITNLIEQKRVMARSAGITSGYHEDVAAKENEEKTAILTEELLAMRKELNEIKSRSANEITHQAGLTSERPISGGYQSSPRQVATDDVAVVRRVVVPTAEPIARVVEPSEKNDFTKLSPTELKKAFKKTYLSENKHLSTYQIDDRFDVKSDLSAEGFVSARDLSETSSGVRPLEIKIGFRSDDSALSRDNYNLLSEYASLVVSNPKRAVQVSIPEKSTRNFDGRKLAARRLAIVEQVLRDTGVADSRIVPVLSQRSDDAFVLRVISSDQFEAITQSRRDMFGDTIDKKSYKSLSW